MSLRIKKLEDRSIMCWRESFELAIQMVSSANAEEFITIGARPRE
jgi:hypothetical protein